MFTLPIEFPQSQARASEVNPSQVLQGTRKKRVECLELATHYENRRIKVQRYSKRKSPESRVEFATASTY